MPDLGHLGLADARLALEEEGAAELERKVHRDRQRAIGDVLVPAQCLTDLIHRVRDHESAG
jgi:hypothetical protein